MSYDKKTTLHVCYHWDEDNECTTVFFGEFENLNAAYERMEKILPENYDFDDGNDPYSWDKDIADGDDDVFTQYVAYVDDSEGHYRYLLAVLRPVLP